MLWASWTEMISVAESEVGAKGVSQPALTSVGEGDFEGVGKQNNID